MAQKYDLPKAPKLPTVSVILMAIFYIGGSLLISLKGLPLLSIGIDIAGLLVCFVWYLFIVLGSFYFAYFENVNGKKDVGRGGNK